MRVLCRDVHIVLHNFEPAGNGDPSGRRRGCSHSPRHHAAQAAASFTILLRQGSDEGPPPPSRKRHGASSRTKPR